MVDLTDGFANDTKIREIELSQENRAEALAQDCDRAGTTRYALDRVDLEN